MADTVVAVGTAAVDKVVVAGSIVVVASVVVAIVAAHIVDLEMEVVVVASVVVAIVDLEMEVVAKFKPFQRYTINYQSSVYLV